jgi:hypothetical protein
MSARSFHTWRASILASVLGVAVPFATLPSAALAAGPKVTPDDAARKRAEAQVLGRDLASADPAAAGMHYDGRAAEWGDPILYLDAADAYLLAADKDGEMPMAEAAIERARISLDLLYFHLDSASDSSFRMVETGDIPDLILRANETVKKGEKLLEDLARREDGAAAAVDKPAKEKRERKPIKTKAMFVSGAVVASIGGALAAFGSVGLIIGAVNQKKAEDPTVYGTEYDAVAAKGERGNLIAGVGLGVGGALVLGGVAMIIIAKIAEKKQGKKTSNVALMPALNGVAISGRF